MVIEKNPSGHLPKFARTAFVHESAVLIGNIIVGKNVFIGPCAVIRADERSAKNEIEPILIGEGANIQDGVIIHALNGRGVIIGRKTSLAHGALVHGPAEVGRNCFVGFRSIIFKAKVGDGSIVMHDCLVENISLPRKLYVPSWSAIQSTKDLTGLAKPNPDQRTFADQVATTNVMLAQQYHQRTLHPTMAIRPPIAPLLKTRRL